MAQRPTISKPTPLSSSAAKNRIAQGGPEGGPAPHMLESIQSEISAEAAPLWDFVVDNSRAIATAVVAVIAAIVVYGGWQWKRESDREAAMNKMASITSVLDPAARLAQLEEFRPQAPASVMLAVEMETGAAAVAANQLDTARQAYERAARADGDKPMGVTARLALADVLARQGDYAASVRELDALLPLFDGDAAATAMIKDRIAQAAEAGGDVQRAIQIYQELLQALPDPDSNESAYLARLIERLNG